MSCLIDGKRGICDVTDFGQEVAHYVDRRYRLHLFPKALDGLQLILSRYIENDLESVGFKVNDTYVVPTRPLIERTMLIRHKERKRVHSGMDHPSTVSAMARFVHLPFGHCKHHIDQHLIRHLCFNAIHS